MARLIRISYPEYYEDMIIDGWNRAIDPILNAEASRYGPRRGDVIRIDEAPNYRNDGKLMWDRGGLVHLAYDLDDYGSVPSMFTVGDEFLADHWEGLIVHNEIVWVDTAKYRDQLLANLSYRGTYYDAPLGRFDIRLMSHSPTVGMNALRDIIENNDVAHFDRKGPYLMTFSYSLYDELSSITDGVGNSDWSSLNPSKIYSIRFRDGSRVEFHRDEEDPDLIYAE